MNWPVQARRAFLGLVALLFVSGQVQVWWTRDPRDLLQALTVVVLTAPLPWARRWPLPVLVVVLAGVALDQVGGAGLGQAWFAVLLAVYALGSWGSARESAAGMVLVAAGVLTVDIPRLQAGTSVDEVVPAWCVIAGTWGLGRWLRSRRAEHAALVAHNSALEHDREEASRAAVAYERARIARELHDLVAHSMAVIVLQAQASQRVLPENVEAARRSLAAIESVGRAGMDELRRLLDVLLVDPEGGGEPEARPSLDRLDDLVDQVRSAGLEVTVEVDGAPAALPPGLDLSAYRIVQEALTNALKHGEHAPTSVLVGYGAETLTIRVSNPAVGRGPTVRRVGHGLISMRERAALYGGEFEAGPDPDGAFVVHATLPLEAR